MGIAERARGLAVPARTHTHTHLSLSLCICLVSVQRAAEKSNALIQLNTNIMLLASLIREGDK